jgi:hypothetical protein
LTTYEWTSASREEYDPLGHVPVWFTTFESNLVLSVASPSAEDWRLVRTEAYCSVQARQVGPPLVGDPYAQITAVSTRLLADVFPFGSTDFPDPLAGGDVRAVWSAALSPRSFAFDPHTAGAGAAWWSTEGYITSQGQRGPDDYGGGQGQVNFGVWSANCLDSGWPDVADSGFVIVARALWKLP